MLSAPVFESTPIAGLFKVLLDHRPDSRGWFEEVWQLEKWAVGPLSWFRPVQQNSSSNLVAGSTRGLHAEPWNKLVTVVSGRAFCVWVDLREGPGFGSKFWQTLSPGEAFFVPEGVANGYQSLEPNTVYTYLVDDHWSPDKAYPAVNPFDPKLEIPWPIPETSTEVSEKDQRNPKLTPELSIPSARPLIFGSSGQVGKALQLAFPNSIPGNRAETRGTDLQGQRFSAVINAAAFTSVDAAEEPEAWPSVLEGNQILVRNLAQLARDLNVVFVHYSSDYVFDGSKTGPWFEDDLPNPVSRYGQSKLLGDCVAQSLDRHYLIRTSWVYGDGKNFIRTMYERASRGEASTVVDDQFGRPTWARDIALFTKHLMESKAPFGTYNFSVAGDQVSWHEVAVCIYEYLGRGPELVSRVSSEEYLAKNPSSAKRPMNSVLDVTKARETGFEMTDWTESLTEYLTILDQSANPERLSPASRRPGTM